MLLNISFQKRLFSHEFDKVVITYNFYNDNINIEEKKILKNILKKKNYLKIRKITKLEKFVVQEFKNCHFPCVILRYLVLINKELFNRYNYVTKFRFQQITYLNKSPFTTASLFRHSRF